MITIRNAARFALAGRDPRPILGFLQSKDEGRHRVGGAHMLPEWDWRMKEPQSILNGSQMPGLEGSLGPGN